MRVSPLLIAALAVACSTEPEQVIKDCVQQCLRQACGVDAARAACDNNCATAVKTADDAGCLGEAGDAFECAASRPVNCIRTDPGNEPFDSACADASNDAVRCLCKKNAYAVPEICPYYLDD